MRIKSIVATITPILKKYIYGITIQANRIFLSSDAENVEKTIKILKTNMITKGETLIDIFSVDTNQTKRFNVTYTIWNYKDSIRYLVRTHINQWTPLKSLNDIFPSASWLEREIWDMHGIKFLNHPDLRRILTDYGFQGHPLRKDFPLMGYLEVRYEDSLKAIIMEPVELAQNFRYYKFENKWEK